MTSFAGRRLLATMRAGRIDGLLGLYDRHGPDCLQIAGRLVDGAPAAEEIVFEVFLGLSRHFTPRHIPLRKWLHEETRRARLPLPVGDHAVEDGPAGLTRPTRPGLIKHSCELSFIFGAVVPYRPG